MSKSMLLISGSADIQTQEPMLLTTKLQLLWARGRGL